MNRSLIFLIAVMNVTIITAQNKLDYLIDKPVDCSINSGSVDHYWSKCVSAGRANEGLRASWLEQLEMVHKSCGFEYVRFHGLFHDDMFVFNYDADSNVVYNWQYVDDVYDRMLAIGVKPFVEFSFFPKAMSPDATVFWWGAHGTPPSDYTEWSNMIEAFLQHCIQRYGIDEIRKWYFEVWNEPNLGNFWKGTREQYFQLYKTTATIVKKADSQLRVGGPATSSYHPAEGVYDSLHRAIKNIQPSDFENVQCEGPWIEAFLDFCEKENLPVDFVSSHPYPTTYPFGDGGGQFEMSRPVNSLHKDLTWLNNVINKSNYKNAEIHLTEWSSSPSPRDHTHDYLQAATYIVKANIECMGMANSLAYWIFTDIVEEAGAGTSIFHGGWGLLNYQGIAKPAFHAYRFLNELGNELVYKNDGFILTKHSQTGLFTGLFYNYPEGVESAPLSTGSRDKAEKTLNTGSSKIVKLHLTGLNPSSKFEIEIVDKNNAFALKSWQAMGSPEPPTREQTAELKAAGMKTLKLYIETNSKGEFKWDYSLKPWSIALLHQLN